MTREHTRSAFSVRFAANHVHVMRESFRDVRKIPPQHLGGPELSDFDDTMSEAAACWGIALVIAALFAFGLVQAASWVLP